MEAALAPGSCLKAYLALERAMVELDDAGDPVGDELRDRMDPIWLKLSVEDRAALDHRVGDPLTTLSSRSMDSSTTSQSRRRGRKRE